MHWTCSKKSIQVAESFAYNLLTNNSNAVPEITKYVEAYDFYIFPFVNPDGDSILIPRCRHNLISV